MTFRVTGRVRMPVGRKVERKAVVIGPTEQLCRGCEYYDAARVHCFHPTNGKPCNPARRSPWTHPKACPVSRSLT